MMTTFTNDINYENTSLYVIFYSPHIRNMGVYCVEVVCDSDFVFAQYLENELMEFDQILHMH